MKKRIGFILCIVCMLAGCTGNKNELQKKADYKESDIITEKNENDNQAVKETKEVKTETMKSDTDDITKSTTENITTENKMVYSETTVSETVADISINETTYEKEQDVISEKVTDNNSQNNYSNTVSDNIVMSHGALHVSGNSLVDKNNNPYKLYGMSTHGIAWFPQYINYECFKNLKDDWNVNCIRLAMYTSEYNGYCTGGNKDELKQLIKNGVNYASELGMYVIIDWHVLNDRNPNVYKSEAIAFFDEMSALYAGNENVIYEICNEPNGEATWDDIRAYASEVIPVIKKHDSDALIIVGTPVWSQETDKALQNPLPYDNVMYALHFYAATHTQWLRDRLKQCEDAGLPVFVSEFGMCDASGNGGNDFNQASEWLSLMRQYNISYCCWNLSNKNETSSVIGSWCNKTSGFNIDDLSESGKWIREQFRNEKR